jgi:hypothetical protein
MADQQLVESISCPHCGLRFPPDRLHFVARSPALSFDHRLEQGARRFLPSRFTVGGDAIDAGGDICTETACPFCHLSVPRVLAVRRTLSFSIFGSPSSGKSYLLGAMSRMMRRCTGNACVRYEDVDVNTNAILLDYERRMFNQSSPAHWVWLDKTGEEGDWYSNVWYGPRTDAAGAAIMKNRRTHPKPFMLRLELGGGHPAEQLTAELGRVVCLYDNAGEHYQTSDDRRVQQTSHLRHADGMIFVYDPTQEESFRRACRERSDDPQFTGPTVDTQEILFGNVMNRILILRSMAATDVVRTPLVVALTKFDAWKFLLDHTALPEVFRDVNRQGTDGGRQVIRAIDPLVLAEVSTVCRELLRRVAPGVVELIESRCDRTGVFYVPVSATGGGREGKTGQSVWPFGPEPEPPAGYDFFLAGKIRPMWAEVPMLTLLHRCVPGLVPAVARG